MFQKHTKKIYFVLHKERTIHKILSTLTFLQHLAQDEVIHLLLFMEKINVT